MHCHRSPLRRSTAVLAASLVLFSCVRYLAAPTWAWFTDNSTASSQTIQAANFDLNITITPLASSPIPEEPVSQPDPGLIPEDSADQAEPSVIPEDSADQAEPSVILEDSADQAEPSVLPEETPDQAEPSVLPLVPQENVPQESHIDVTARYDESVGRYYEASLSAGVTYQITLQRTADSTASQGHCLIYADSTLYYTEPIDAYTVTADNQWGLSFAFTPAEEGAFLFQPSWGQFTGTSSALYSMTPPVYIRNGDTIAAEQSAPLPEDTFQPQWPDLSQPEADQPETDQPETPELPDLDLPESPDSQETPAPDVPEQETQEDPEPQPEEQQPEQVLPPPYEETVIMPEVSIIPSPSDGDQAIQDFLWDYVGFTPGEMPLYFQNDYPDVRYGAGTIETSGCGITCLAMVASYLTGYQYMPDQLAGYFGGAAENNMARLELGSTTLQLPWTKAVNIHETMDALKEGKVVIALMESGSLFTESQHFIVLKEMTEDEKIIVYDPYRPNYDRWDLKDGFENGFSEYQILQGYSGAWIYDPEAMPEEPFYYEEVKPTVVQTRYSGVNLTLEEEDLIAKVIWVEAQGECAEGQQAVAEIILNRLISGKFGETVSNVIYGQGQFRSVPRIPEATPWQAQYDALEAALTGPNILPEDVYYFATTPTNDNIWGKIGGHIFCYED